MDRLEKKFHASAIMVGMISVLMLTLPFMGRGGFWFDEIFAVTTASSWQQLGTVLLTYENNMALYFVLLYGWLWIADSEFTIRLLSTLFAVAAIPVLHVLVHRLLGLRVAVIADVLLATNTMFLEHAMEARSYSLLVLLSITGSLLFISGLKRPTWGIWLSYAVCMAMAVYAHYFAALVLVAHASALLWPGRPSLPWRHGLVSGLLVIVLVMPLILLRPATTLGQIDWIEKPNLTAVMFVGIQFAGGRSLWFAYLVALALGVLTFIRRGDAHGQRERWPLLFVLTWLVVPISIALVFSLICKPVFVTKYLIEALPAVIILAAVGIARLPNWLIGMVLAGFLGALLVNYARRGVGHNGPYREIAQRVVHDAQPDDAVICYPYFMKLPFSYYAARQSGSLPPLEPAAIASAPYHPGGGSVDPAPDFAAIEAVAKSHRRLWLIINVVVGPERMNRQYRPQIEQTIARHATKSTTIDFPSPDPYENFTVIIYERQTAETAP